jgi:hypothetical protein
MPSPKIRDLLIGKCLDPALLEACVGTSLKCVAAMMVPAVGLSLCGARQSQQTQQSEEIIPLHRVPPVDGISLPQAPRSEHDRDHVRCG